VFDTFWSQKFYFITRNVWSYIQMTLTYSYKWLLRTRTNDSYVQMTLTNPYKWLLRTRTNDSYEPVQIKGVNINTYLYRIFDSRRLYTKHLDTLLYTLSSDILNRFELNVSLLVYTSTAVVSWQYWLVKYKYGYVLVLRTSKTIIDWFTYNCTIQKYIRTRVQLTNTWTSW